MVKNISYNSFIEQYIHKVEFDWQSTPVQVYPLENIHSALDLPTPLLHTEYYFFVFLKKGCFIQQLGTETLNVSSGAVHFVRQGEVFSIISVSDQIEGYFVLMDKKVLSAILNPTENSNLTLLQSVIYLSEKDILWFDQICKLLFDELESKTPNRKIGSGFVQVLLSKLIALNKGKRLITRQGEIATRFKELLNKYFSENQSVFFYAQKLGVSENYLNRCVKAQLGKSAKKIILEKTVQQSQILMFETTLDISEIAFQVGFTDPSHFSRVFKKITGETPSNFKSRIKHGLS